MTQPIANPERLRQIQDSILATAERPLEQATALPTGAYTDPDFYNWEVEHVLKKQWLCVGHISQIPAVGDYLNVDLLGERLTITRDRESCVSVFSRVCAHRGMDLMPAAYGHSRQGNRRSFVCPYHHWSYDLGGNLIGAPEMDKHVGFDKQNFCLPRFRSEVWEGFIFVTFDAELASVKDRYLGLLPFLGHRQMGKLELAIDLKWDCPFNWKILVENFMEPYHHLGAHHKTFEPIMPASKTWTESEAKHYIACHLPFAKRITDSPEERGKLLEFDLSPLLEPQDLGEYTVYLGEPSFLLFVGPDRVYWYGLRPEGPDRMTLHTTLLIEPGFQQSERYERVLQKATEDLKQFHIEDMEVCSAVQAGLQSTRYQPGPLSHLEMPIWLFQRYLARQILQARVGVPAET